MVHLFKRKLYDRMLNWKQRSNGSSALLIQGARRVGKSTLAEYFAQTEYESYILIDFTNCSKEIANLFEEVRDLDHIYNKLSVEYGASLTPRKSAIIFDEVQNCPRARQAIKHLVKDGRFDFIETGSLISIKKNVKDILIPSEEEIMNMYPLDYEEFRWALGDTVTMPMLKELFNQEKSLGDGTNRKLMRDFRLYMLVGGMPQAISAYLETKDLSFVDEVKRRIITLYINDFRKFSNAAAPKTLQAIPAELNRNSTRYQLSSVNASSRAKREADMLTDMEDSMVVNMSYRANDPGIGMAFNMDINRFKMFLGDTGLFVTLAFWDKGFVDNIIYSKLLSDKLSADMGYVYENVVSQMLVASGHKLFYYTFPTEKGNHFYEIDFLLADGDKISPIEVRSSSYKRHKSLDQFCEKFSDRIRHRYLIYTKDYRKDDKITYLPIYMTPFL